MRKCDQCNKSTDKPKRVVVERKMVDHASAGGQGPRGGRGTQIVREVTVCPDCLSSTPEAPLPEPIVVVEATKPSAFSEA